MKLSTSSLLIISAALLAATAPQSTSAALLAATAPQSTSATPLAFNADDDSISVPIQVPFSSTPRVLTFPNWFHSSNDDDDDVCPRLPVSCVRDGKIIGDIGEQDFCRQGLTCKMCNPKKKSLDCNTKYIKECATQCSARGPLGGKLHQVQHKIGQVFNAKGDEDDICPDLKVSCKNADGKTVGDIGKKPFCRDGVTCGQCHQTENSVECNAKFVGECKAQCEATGPLGGKGGVFVHLY